MANSDLQNSYGPEMAPNGHDAPQTVAGDGLEAMHAGHQYPIAPPYNEQHAKNNQYYPAASEQPHDPGRKKRVAGLPVVAFWGVIIGLVLILAIGLGVGLGVGLSQRNSSGGSAAETTAATASASTTAAAEITSTASATPSSSTAGTTTSSRTITSTTSATSAAATARNVEICNQASLAMDCTNITVPVNTCMNFPSAYNDSVSSVDTGGPECSFYVGATCSGESWTTSGTNYLIPAEYNDAFSSVACFV